MNEVQSRLLKMYVDIKRSLDGHGIRFYGGFGTALGAVRHDGFIPWDDDIDLMVWEEDLPRVAQALKADLDPDVYYYHESTCDDHPHVICMEGGEESIRDRTALFIDIFPLKPYPDGMFRKAVENAAIQGDNVAIYVLDRIGSDSIHRMLSWTHRFFYKLADMASGPGCGKVTVRSTTFKDFIFPREYLGVPVPHVFEDEEMPLPQEWDLILTSTYGDYMTPPPEGKRKGAAGFPCCAYRDYLSDKKKKGV